MKKLSPRTWLVEREKMKDISPKEYYKKLFEELLDEIKENMIQAQNIITIKK